MRHVYLHSHTSKDSTTFINATDAHRRREDTWMTFYETPSPAEKQKNYNQQIKNKNNKKQNKKKLTKQNTTTKYKDIL